MYAGSPRQLWYPPGSVIAIDLGNTNSCVAGYAPGKTTVAKFQFCIPSWVAFTEDGTTLVGEAARNHAGIAPEAAVFGFKRLLGLRRNHVYEEGIVQRHIERVPYKIGARNVDRPSIPVKAKDGTVKQLDLTKVASMVIAQLKDKAEEHLGGQVEYAVMTIPQHFSGPSRQAAELAGKIAELHVIRTISEPTAVAVAYGLERKLREDGNAFVLHVGGGTSDASIVTLMDGYFEIFVYWNDPFLGGDDFDQRIVDYFAKLIKRKHGKDISEDRIALGKLRTACEHAKKALSSQDHVHVTVKSLFDGVDFSEPLSRSEFEELNDDLFRKVIAIVDRVMVQAKLEKSKNKIDEIVLVGGSVMIPKIQRLVKDYFDGREPNIRVKPDEAVALGAAYHVHYSD
ncbi:Luminal-binding protein 5 [Dichanthelium oligosanthes]|uniref:Luminal-binding protein 5 n=1 Tax=Dichanthelium oligosanthes TaxID=888268 RepID=A0A1E5W337_9POAL|nr:Luminal-binding protein 5 [Dichanthelium oligosanthes]